LQRLEGRRVKPARSRHWRCRVRVTGDRPIISWLGRLGCRELQGWILGDNSLVSIYDHHTLSGGLDSADIPKPLSLFTLSHSHKDGGLLISRIYFCQLNSFVVDDKKTYILLFLSLLAWLFYVVAYRCFLVTLTHPYAVQSTS